jgi:hypothetical protein
MATEDLLKRLGDPEDNFVERKPPNSNREDIRKTVVAFANSVPEGRTGVLFIGVRNDGKIEAVPNPDKLQKTVRGVCEQECYPPIKFFAEVLQPQNGPVLAIVVPASSGKPHFAGPAYIRRGSESVIASPELFEQLVYSRNSKCAAVLKLQGQIVTVQALEHRLGETKRISDSSYREASECRVEAANPQTVRLRILASDRYVTEPLDHVTVNYDEEKHRPMLVVTGY